MIKTMKTYFSGLIKKTKIHYWRTIATTIAMFVIVILNLMLTFVTTRIREIYIFSYKNDNLNFEAYEIILGALIYPVPTNCGMIIVATVNIHSISFLNLICEVMERFEQIELKPSLMIIKSLIPAKQPNELDGENEIFRVHASTQMNTEQEKLLSISSIVAKIVNNDSEEGLTESQRRNKEYNRVAERMSKTGNNHRSFYQK